MVNIYFYEGWLFDLIVVWAFLPHSNSDLFLVVEKSVLSYSADKKKVNLVS